MVLEDIEVGWGRIFLTLKINFLLLEIRDFLQFSELTPEHTSDNDILRGK